MSSRSVCPWSRMPTLVGGVEDFQQKGATKEVKQMKTTEQLKEMKHDELRQEEDAAHQYWVRVRAFRDVALALEVCE